MTSHKNLLTLIFILLVSAGWQTGLYAQNNSSEQDTSGVQDTTITQKVDSLVGDRLTRLDSLARQLEQQVGLSEDTTSVSGDADR